MVARAEMMMKIHFSSPRPYFWDDRVMPVIDTPTHSSYPSGHATEAFAYAIMLRALSEGDLPTATRSLVDEDGLEMLDEVLFRQAFRIAENRVVAGVHYPVDSAAGFVLGASVAEDFVAACAAESPTYERRQWTLAKWDENGAARTFDHHQAHDALESAIGGDSSRLVLGDPVYVDPANELMRRLFSNARAEWT